MADITMCDNGVCQLANKCYRKTAKPSRYQSYANFKRNCDETCNYFIERAKPKKATSSEQVTDIERESMELELKRGDLFIHKKLLDRENVSIICKVTCIRDGWVHWRHAHLPGTKGIMKFSLENISDHVLQIL